MKTIISIMTIGILLTLPAAAHAIMLNQVDDFQTGTTLGWAGGQIGAPPANIPNGGPSGAGDGFLQINTTGYHLGSRNITQWTGDYTSAGINAIEMDLNHINPSTDSVEIRILIFGPGGGFASTNVTPSIGANTWQTYTFGLTAADLTYLQNGGTGNLADTLADVTKLHFRHDNPTLLLPGGHGPPSIAATLGIDNIRAIPEPATLSLLALSGLAMTKRRREK